jgi:hypothetical protein
MDPTEIMAVPLPLSTLGNFVGFSSLGLFLVSVPWWDIIILWNELQRLFRHTLCMLTIIFLCGANPTNKGEIIHTILASFYMASLLTFQPCVFAKKTLHDDDNNNNPRMKTSRFYATLLMTIPFQILQILDSGLQVQRWPIPLLLGSTVGWVVGNVVGLLIVITCTKGSCRNT